MELKELLEKFLPYYKEKRERRHDLTDEQFWILFFSEALQNFTDKICEEQRKNCLDALYEEYNYHHTNKAIIEHENYVCLQSEQPKINDL